MVLQLVLPLPACLPETICLRLPVPATGQFSPACSPRPRPRHLPPPAPSCRRGRAARVRRRPRRLCIWRRRRRARRRAACHGPKQPLWRRHGRRLQHWVLWRRLPVGVCAAQAQGQAPRPQVTGSSLPAAGATRREHQHQPPAASDGAETEGAAPSAGACCEPPAQSLLSFSLNVAVAQSCETTTPLG